VKDKRVQNSGTCENSTFLVTCVIIDFYNDIKIEASWNYGVHVDTVSKGQGVSLHLFFSQRLGNGFAGLSSHQPPEADAGLCPAKSDELAS